MAGEKLSEAEHTTEAPRGSENLSYFRDIKRKIKQVEARRSGERHPLKPSVIRLDLPAAPQHARLKLKPRR